MDLKRNARLLDVLELCASGEPLREGLERILRSGRGALIVLGDGEAVQQVASGGFAIDADFTAQRLAELAKMDGAIVCDAAVERIRRANVHLVPDPHVPTSESGIRHRTAERTARQTKAPVIAVSEAMHTVTLYVEDSKHTLEPVESVLARANQALQTLQRYRVRFDEVASGLSALEVEDLVTLRDVASLLQRAEMVLRIRDDLQWLIAELGRDGRLVQMQLEELLSRLEEDRELVVRDYYVTRGGRKPESVVGHLSELGPSGLVDPTQFARLLGYPANHESLDESITPRGYRVLSRIPRIPQGVEESIVRRFATLPKIMRASLEDLDEVEGVGEARARRIREGLSRLTESSMLDRYG